MNPEITAVICTHNRAGLMDMCIQSLYDQTLEQGRYEVIVVDNASTDDTATVCRKYRDYAGFRYVEEPIPGLSQARNTGWRSANSPYVGYIDDDATANPKWLEKALWCFENTDPQPDWVGGAIFLDWEISPPSWICEYYEISLGKVYWGDKPRFLGASGERLGGGNSFYKKEILKNLDGFDVRLGRKKGLLLSAEETQLQHRLEALGGRLFYHPDVSINHFVPRERTRPKWFYRRFYWEGRSNLIMEKSLSAIQHEKLVSELPEDTMVTRLLINLIKSLGLFGPNNETIKGRIYMAYVIGWIDGKVRDFIRA